jgi:hypothetical protein
MGLGDQQDGPAGRQSPASFSLLRSLQASAPRPQQVSIADIYHAAANRAIQDHELDKLFNPDFYDYQI